jgi:hypothetical protein
MSDVAAARDISPEEGQRIVAEAATWKDTPYDARGANSIKGVLGDCSGSTFQIYKAAGFPYAYQITGSFMAYARSSGVFRSLAAGEPSQDGDILYWPGHMAIYSTFSSNPANAMTTVTNTRTGGTSTFQNDMWTAYHPGGQPYGPFLSRKWSPVPPIVFRYQRSGAQPVQS